MKRIKSVFCVAILILICSSCEKVIDVKLDSSATQIVIEGEVSTAKGPYQVKVTETKNFDENNSFPGRDDAIVIIKDLTSGNTETLTNIGAGGYQTSALQGIGGHAYQLSVALSGKTYTATSTIPLMAVKLESLSAQPFSLDADKIFMVPVFTDPIGSGNSYRLKQWVNDVPVRGSNIRNDEATDGRTYDSPLYYNTEDDFDNNPVIHNGDRMTVELQGIDKGVYDYYRTLNTTIDQESAAPSNPLTNITGGALGVFNACNSNKLTAIAKF